MTLTAGIGALQAPMSNKVYPGVDGERSCNLHYVNSESANYPSVKTYT